MFIRATFVSRGIAELNSSDWRFAPSKVAKSQAEPAFVYVCVYVRVACCMRSVVLGEEERKRSMGLQRALDEARSQASISCLQNCFEDCNCQLQLCWAAKRGHADSLGRTNCWGRPHDALQRCLTTPPLSLEQKSWI